MIRRRAPARSRSRPAASPGTARQDSAARLTVWSCASVGGCFAAHADAALQLQPSAEVRPVGRGLLMIVTLRILPLSVPDALAELQVPVRVISVNRFVCGDLAAGLAGGPTRRSLVLQDPCGPRSMRMRSTSTSCSPFVCSFWSSCSTGSSAPVGPGSSKVVLVSYEAAPEGAVSWVTFRATRRRPFASRRETVRTASVRPPERFRTSSTTVSTNCRLPLGSLSNTRIVVLDPSLPRGATSFSASDAVPYSPPSEIRSSRRVSIRTRQSRPKRRASGTGRRFYRVSSRMAGTVRLEQFARGRAEGRSRLQGRSESGSC